VCARAATPSLRQRLVLQQPPSFIVARESVEIALEPQDREDPHECPSAIAGFQLPLEKVSSVRCRALTGDVDRELSAQARESQPLSERGEDALLGR